MCDNLDGPLFTKSVSSVFKIKYANGTSQVMNSPSNNYYNSNNNNNSLGSLGGNINDDNIDKAMEFNKLVILVFPLLFLLWLKMISFCFGKDILKWFWLK